MKILLVDPDKRDRERIAKILVNAGGDVDQLSTLDNVSLELLAEYNVFVVNRSVRGESAVMRLAQVQAHKLDGLPAIVVMSGNVSKKGLGVEEISAMHELAAEFFSKHDDSSDLIDAVNKAVLNKRTKEGW